jgi:hypothetical protein
LRNDLAKAQKQLNFAKSLTEVRNKEFDKAMNLIIDELRELQKTLRGNYLLQLVEKILSV